MDRRILLTILSVLVFAMFVTTHGENETNIIDARTYHFDGNIDMVSITGSHMSIIYPKFTGTEDFVFRAKANVIRIETDFGEHSVRFKDHGDIFLHVSFVGTTAPSFFISGENMTVPGMEIPNGAKVKYFVNATEHMAYIVLVK